MLNVVFIAITTITFAETEHVACQAIHSENYDSYGQTHWKENRAGNCSNTFEDVTFFKDWGVKDASMRYFRERCPGPRKAFYFKIKSKCYQGDTYYYNNGDEYKGNWIRKYGGDECLCYDFMTYFIPASHRKPVWLESQTKLSLKI